jgi:hypothetical protein
MIFANARSTYGSDAQTPRSARRGKTPVGERDWLTGTVCLPVGGLLVWVLGVFRSTVSEEYGVSRIETTQCVRSSFQPLSLFEASTPDLFLVNKKKPNLSSHLGFKSITKLFATLKLKYNFNKDDIFKPHMTPSLRIY